METEHVAIYLRIVSAVLKNIDTDLDFALFLQFQVSFFICINVPERIIYSTLSLYLSPNNV